MILYTARTLRIRIGIPRASGGDPVYGQDETNQFDVFPAQAGVIPDFIQNLCLNYGIPRASGGDPQVEEVARFIGGYSPRKRG